MMGNDEADSTNFQLGKINQHILFLCAKWSKLFCQPISWPPKVVFTRLACSVLLQKPYFSTFEQGLYTQYIVLQLLPSKCYLVKIQTACRSLVERCTVYIIPNRPNSRQTSRPTFRSYWVSRVFIFFKFCILEFLYLVFFFYAFHLMLSPSVCVCLRVCISCFWTSGKRHEIVTSLFFHCAE